jgi:hypothetical protein
VGEGETAKVYIYDELIEIFRPNKENSLGYRR